MFDWLQKTARVDNAEMYRTFNSGIGMIAVVPPDHADAAIKLLLDRGETASLIGEVRAGTAGVVIHE